MHDAPRSDASTGSREGDDLAPGSTPPLPPPVSEGVADDAERGPGQIAGQHDTDAAEMSAVTGPVSRSVSGTPSSAPVASEPRSEPSLEQAEPTNDPPTASREDRTDKRRDRGKLVAFGAMGALVVAGIALIAVSPRGSSTSPPVALTNGDLAPSASVVAPVVTPGATTMPEPKAAPPPDAPRPRPPPAWRVASLKGDDASRSRVDVLEGTFAKGGFVQVLMNAGLSRSEVRRMAHALDGVHHASRPSATDAFVVAKDKATGAVTAFEFVVSPFEIWQGKEENAQLTTQKLDLFVEHKRIASALVIGADLAKAVAAAGLRPEIVDDVDEALDGHLEGGLHAGTRLRIAGSEDWVEGTFVRSRVEAIEVIPKAGNTLRIYHYERGGDVEGNRRRAPAPGFYDAKGRQPYKGAFRTPLPLARVTSRYNPKRLHPVLKVVMPHNGVDYGAGTGTPVYASATGTVTTAGNGGPCGNMVEIQHAGNITTAYCHLSRFAQGLHSGQKVEARQLIGYVGQTGRVTGPHLHFAVKRAGAFIDPLGLKMDGVRVLPQADRDAFAKRRGDLDQIIDGVAVPSAADVPDEPEDKDLHE